MTGTALPFGAVYWLAGFTVLWVGGFDIIYATADEEFDRKAGLHSMPSALGSRNALWVAAATHAVAFGLLAWMTYAYLDGPLAWLLLAVVGGLLVAEHVLAHRVDLAFFRINAWLGFVVFALVWAGL